MLKQAGSKAAASKRRLVPLRYVESLRAARTPLPACFSILRKGTVLFVPEDRERAPAEKAEGGEKPYHHGHNHGEQQTRR